MNYIFRSFFIIVYMDFQIFSTANAAIFPAIFPDFLLFPSLLPKYNRLHSVATILLCYQVTGKYRSRLQLSGLNFQRKKCLARTARQDTFILFIILCRILNNNPKEPFISIVNTLSLEILDQIPEKKRGTGAVICMCPAPGALRENVLQLPYWYI